MDEPLRLNRKQRRIILSLQRRVNRRARRLLAKQRKRDEEGRRAESPLVVGDNSGVRPGPGR